MSAISNLSAAEVIRLLDLAPHPEGGHFREIFRDQRPVEGGRAASTAIYFLLAAGERSHWHRVDAAEVWHFYAGAPLALEIARNEKDAVERLVLGNGLAHRRAAANRGTGARLAGGRKPRRLDACRLHGGAGFRVFRALSWRRRSGWSPESVVRA